MKTLAEIGQFYKYNKRTIFNHFNQIVWDTPITQGARGAFLLTENQEKILIAHIKTHNRDTNGNNFNTYNKSIHKKIKISTKSAQKSEDNEDDFVF